MDWSFWGMTAAGTFASGGMEITAAESRAELPR
jgi:hypothetical protein